MADINEDYADLFVSDGEWAEELQFQEVLEASLLMQESSKDLFVSDDEVGGGTAIPKVVAASLLMEESSKDDEVGGGTAIPKVVAASLLMQESSKDLFVSDGEWAEELQFQEVVAASLLMQESSKGFCDICMENKDRNEMFKLENCSHHSFCSDCIVQYVQSKIQDRIFLVTCPASKCRATIEPVFCKSIIPEDVFEKWEGGLSESTLPEREKFYCPYKDCSELVIYDQDEDITMCICPACQRLLCAACGVAWHTGLNCDEFQKDKKNREDDLKVEELANNSKWMRCPNCKHMVQKDDGCIHMTCRCRSEFCYICGETWSESHWSCQISA